MAREAGSDTPQRRAAPGISAAVGRAIRDLREQENLTARDLAARSGLSGAMISRIESGQVSPSLATLEQVAATLGVPVVSLFRETGSAVTDFSVVRKGEGLRSRRFTGRHAHDFTVLGLHRRHDLHFESVLVTVERTGEARPPTYSGHGCVFIYVLEGEAVYRYGDQEIALREGDSVSLDAELRYGIERVISPRFRFLSVQAERR